MCYEIVMKIVSCSLGSLFVLYLTLFFFLLLASLLLLLLLNLSFYFFIVPSLRSPFFIFILIVGSCEMFRYAGNHVDRIIVCWRSGCSTLLLSNRITMTRWIILERKVYIEYRVIAYLNWTSINDFCYMHWHCPFYFPLKLVEPTV